MIVHPSCWSILRSRRTLMRLRGSQDTVNTTTTASSSRWVLHTSTVTTTSSNSDAKEYPFLRKQNPYNYAKPGGIGPQKYKIPTFSKSKFFLAPRISLCSFGANTKKNVADRL